MDLLITLLALLFWAGIVYLALWLLFFFAQKLMGKPVEDRPKQIIYALVGILFVIWVLLALTGKATVPVLPFVK